MKIKFFFIVSTVLLTVLMLSACNSGNKESTAETSMKDTIITRVDTQEVQMPDGTWRDTIITRIDSIQIEK